MLPWIKPELYAVANSVRNAKATVKPCTDDWCDLDYVGAELKLAWRGIVISELGAEILGD